MKFIDTCKARYPRTFNYLQGSIVTVARYHLAGIFLLSGISKAINPYGQSLKIGEYFSALGLYFLRPLAELGGVLMPAAELVIGLMLLTGISRRVTAWLALSAMGFFTLLTLWLALANPISDCGCFGDLIHVSNWESFTKNVMFSLFAVIFFLARNQERKRNPSVAWTIGSYAVIIPLALAPGCYAWHHLPIIDPTPFKMGVNIPQAMQGGENALHTTLVYREKATGTLRDFAIEDTTWYDTTRWEYMETRTTGHNTEPAIKNLPMFEGNIDRSDEILQRQGYTLLYVIHSLAPKYEESMGAFASYVNRYNGRTVALSANPLPASLASHGIELLSGDLTVLRTMMQQSRGGALLLYNGTIVGKWSLNDLPSWEQETVQAQSEPLDNILLQSCIGHNRLLTTLFFLVVALLVLVSLRPHPHNEP